MSVTPRGPAPRSYMSAPLPPRVYRDYEREDNNYPATGTRRDGDYPNTSARRPASSPVLKRGEQVEVRIRGNIWIVGFLVSSLHVISSVSMLFSSHGSVRYHLFVLLQYLGLGYDVEYTDQGSRRVLTQQFSQADVRPYTS
ncbi:hypothetical protein BU17DRAFT_83145 [Hysterangium stoloniferum]|nr:hypothetical protein BU17DRAFT_83145 [Hysterangium stoloniferum]